jgi:hypothetical protein
MSERSLGDVGPARWLGVLWVLIGAVCLMAPALVVGHPTYYPDTKAYFQIGQEVGRALHFETPALRPPPWEPGTGPAHPRDPNLGFTLAGARSVYYGVCLFATAALGSTWLTILCQSLAGSALVLTTEKVLVGRYGPRHFLPVILILTAGSSLGFVCVLLLPDLFTGLAGLALILLTFAFDRLSKVERLLLFVLAAASLSLHGSNPPLGLGLCLFAVAVGRLAPGLASATIAGAGTALAAVAVGGMALALYPPAAGALLRHEISRPPFLAARLLADGPGRDYLRRVCAVGRPYALCRFAALPLTRSEDILWSLDPGRGVFEPSDYATRLALTREEPAFAFAVVAASPGEVLETSVANGARQFVELTLGDTLGFPQLPLDCLSLSRPWFNNYACLAPSPARLSSTLVFLAEKVIRLTTWASFAYLALRLLMTLWAPRLTRSLTPLSPRLASCTLSILGLVIANAALCGALNGVFGRYQMRLVWLLPLMAMIAWMERPSVDRAVRP